MLKVILFELINLLFGKSKEDENIDKSSREYKVLSKTLHVNNKPDILERIAYWIEKKMITLKLKNYQI